MKRFRFGITAIPILVLLLTSCQTNGPASLSLAEAKQITGKLESTSFSVPPKSINDITALLDQVSQKNIERIETDKKILSLDVNKTRVCPGETLLQVAGRNDGANLESCSIPATDRELYYFYLERSEAARRLGRTNQRLKDLDKAVGYVEKTTIDTNDVLVIRGQSRIGNGRYSLGKEDIGSALRVSMTGMTVDRKQLAKKFAYTAALYFAEGQLIDGIENLENSKKHFQAALTRESQITYSSGQAVAPDEWFEGTFSYLEGFFSDRQGKLREAEILYRRAIAAFIGRNSWYTDGSAVTTSDFETSLNEFRLALSHNLRQQGRYVEAEAEARLALVSALQHFGQYTTHTARVVMGLAANVFDQGRFAEAEALARRLVRVYTTMGADGASLPVARSRSLLADSLTQQGKWRDALRIYTRIQMDMRADKKAFDLFLRGNLNWAIALIETGNGTEARQILKEAIERKRKLLGDSHYETAEVKALSALAQSDAADVSVPYKLYREALPILLADTKKSAERDSLKAAKDFRLGLILDGYIELLARLNGTPLENSLGIVAARESFRITDVARSRSVQDAVTASGARAAANNEDLADLIRREQDARKQLSVRFGRLADILSSPPEQQNQQVISQLRADTVKLRSARLAIMEEIEERFPEYAELLNPKPATIERVQSIISRNEALISTYVTDEKTYVWAVPKAGPVAFHVAPIGKERLQAVVTDLRRSLDPQAQTLGDIPTFNVSLAHRLYRQLLEPVKSGWEEADNLLVVNHGPLGQLPLSVLVTKPSSVNEGPSPLFAGYKSVSWLARSHSVTVLPSVTSLAALRALPPSRTERKSFAGFGDPLFSVSQAANDNTQVAVARLSSRGHFNVRGLPIRLRSAPKTQKLDSAELARLPRLPDTADEVRSIAVALNADLTNDVFIGKQATETAVKTANLSGYKVLAFATHGLVPGDLNGLHQPALALSTPKLGNTKGDGLLTMGEILSLRLDADWVVLSACNTGAADGAGAEAFSGLGRAFFYAGTRAVLLSNWPVETTSAKLLTTDLFKRQANNPNLSRAQALRRSMISLIDGDGFKDADTGKTIFSYAHPIFWAPFSLVGDGGGTVKPAG